MHNIQKRAVVVDDEIVIRPMMYLALVMIIALLMEKRVLAFLVNIKNLLEDPSKILLGIK